MFIYIYIYICRHYIYIYNYIYVSILGGHLSVSLQTLTPINLNLKVSPRLDRVSP